MDGLLGTSQWANSADTSGLDSKTVVGLPRSKLHLESGGLAQKHCLRTLASFNTWVLPNGPIPVKEASLLREDKLIVSQRLILSRISGCIPDP